MKITKSQLKQIIKEEMGKVLKDKIIKTVIELFRSKESPYWGDNIEPDELANAVSKKLDVSEEQVSKFLDSLPAGNALDIEGIYQDAWGYPYVDTGPRERTPRGIEQTQRDTGVKESLINDLTEAVLAKLTKR